jgi:hypothetical protein
LPITLEDGKLTCDFFETLVGSSGEHLPVDEFSGTLPPLRDLGVVIPRRLPAFAIQLLFPVIEPVDAGVVGRDCG